jgi:hypothetical protein
MAYFNKNWSLDRIIEEFQFMAYSLEAEEMTVSLVPTVQDFLEVLRAMKVEKDAALSEQMRTLAMLHAADRALDISLSALSGQARILEREEPALRLVGTLFPEGLNSVTKYSGRGVESEVLVARNLIGVLSGMPSAAKLVEVTAKVSAACEKAEAVLARIKVIDAQVGQHRTREADLVERAYSAYHATHADLVKLLNNNRRIINSFFLS